MWIRRLSTLDCTKILARNHFAHLGCAMAGNPYVVPIYFSYSDNHLYAFSMPGKKIEFMRANPKACVLVEERGEGRGWRSVLVEGHYQELDETPEHEADRKHAWLLLSRHKTWWEPGGLKPDRLPITDHSTHLFYRIRMEAVSGREVKDQDAP